MVPLSDSALVKLRRVSDWELGSSREFDGALQVRPSESSQTRLAPGSESKPQHHLNRSRATGLEHRRQSTAGAASTHHHVQHRGRLAEESGLDRNRVGSAKLQWFSALNASIRNWSDRRLE